MHRGGRNCSAEHESFEDTNTQVCAAGTASSGGECVEKSVRRSILRKTTSAVNASQSIRLALHNLFSFSIVSLLLETSTSCAAETCRHHPSPSG